MRAVHRIRLGPKMRQHVMSLARFTLMTQRGNVDWRDDDPLARPRRRLREQPSVEVDDL